MSKKIVLPDGKEIEEEFCGTCLALYVRDVDLLETEEYAFEHLTDPKYKHFKVIED